MLIVNDLSVRINKKIVDNISMQIPNGGKFGLIGESGSGKSMTALAIMRLLPPTATYSANSNVTLDGNDLLELTEQQMRQVRGHKIGMIFQDPMMCLNPVLTIKSQLLEVLGQYGKTAMQEAVRLLDAVKIPNAYQRIDAYPHQLSGGMKQRVMIAIALARKPRLLIADEPTTALDVTTQAQILDLLQEISVNAKMALLLITHDLSIAAQYTDQIAVMHGGKIVETNSTKDFFANPQNAYSQKLLNSLPQNIQLELNAHIDKEIFTVSNLRVYYPIKSGLLQRTIDYVRAVDDVSFSVNQGETLAIVGESGSGKTTVGKALLNLIPNMQGQIDTKAKNMQMVFQDPYASLDPKMRIFDSLTEGISKHLDKEQIIDRLLMQVGLLPEHKWRFPHEFSGGERQRLCIARALTVKPDIIVCDEPTSSLDVSVQAQILKLLVDLQREYNIAYVFITHNIALVQLLAQRVLVMRNGKIVEQGITEQVLRNPQHAYTKELLAAVPELRF